MHTDTAPIITLALTGLDISTGKTETRLVTVEEVEPLVWAVLDNGEPTETPYRFDTGAQPAPRRFRSPAEAIASALDYCGWAETTAEALARQ